MAGPRSSRIRFVQLHVAVLGLLVAAAGILATAGLGHAALEKPRYAAGDRWVYVVVGSLGGLPGLNASAGGAFQLGLSGIVQVDVLGTAPAVGGGVQVETRASGFLNGTFAIPGNATIHASGTFSSDTSEVWEGQDYLPVASNSSTAYMIDVTVVITTRVAADVWLNATTSYASLPPFNLSLGDSVSASFTSELTAATSVSLFGFGQHAENRTVVAGVWTRQVLGLENVTVEAGTFAAYRLNESLGAFPGLAAVAPGGGANETAWFSNDVGNDVRRVAYMNATPVGEMRLKSFTYPAQPTGLPLPELLLLIAVPIAAILVLLLLVRRRRKGRGASKASSGVGPVGELPPKDPGGRP